MSGQTVLHVSLQSLRGSRMSSPRHSSGTSMCACSGSRSCPTHCKPEERSPPGSSVHGTSQQEDWSGLPFLPLKDLPGPGDPHPQHLLHWQDSLLLSELGGPSGTGRRKQRVKILLYYLSYLRRQFTYYLF